MSSFQSADSEARAYRNASPGLRFFLTVALSFALMFLDHRGTYLEQIRAYLGATMYPLQVAIDSPAAGLRWIRENLALRERLIAENTVLRSASLIANAELQRLAALRAENARFRALLDSRPRVRNRVVVGEILALDMDPLRHRVVLNKGSRDGAYEGQALIDASGVVGQVTRDRQDSSEGLLITDPDHAVPVEIVRNGLRTIAMGTGDMDRLSLPFLTRNADIKSGDLLVTSGLGGAFPAGYPVGTVTRVDGSAGDAFLEVTARPTAQLDRLHEVLLVFSEPGDETSEASALPADTAATLTPPVVGAPPPTPAAATRPAEAVEPAPAAARPTASEPSPAAASAPATEPVEESPPTGDTGTVTAEPEGVQE